MEKQEKKVDRRVLKTKRAIRNAFAELLSQKDINEITIKDIADAADIDRKTFYNYYAGVYQLVDEIENEIVETLTEVIGDTDLRRDIDNPHFIFSKLTAIINNDLDFYSPLMRSDGNASLVAKIAAALKKKMRSSAYLPKSVTDDTLEVMTEYVFSGMLAVYRNWFNSNREHSIDDVIQTISILTASGINGILGGDA